MPTKLFLHFLDRDYRGSWDDHSPDTWLQRLPKKLNTSILDEARQSGGNPDASDAVISLDVHILEGPNQVGLSLVLALGIAVAFLTSCLLVGIAKTEEQGFGVGQFLIAIMTCGMTAVYFYFEDR